MSFRRALMAFALCASMPVAAASQEPRRVDIAYEISWAGLPGFRINFTGRFDGSRYDVETHTFKEGLIRLLTIRYEGRNRAWGGFLPDGARPVGGSLSIVVGDKPRTWTAQYAGNGTLRERHDPDWTPAPEHVIPADKKQGSLDPLSGALSVGLAGDRACEKTIPSNDGKRRIDVVLKKIGTEAAAASGVPGVRSDLLICEIFTRRVAGEFHDAPKEAESQREQPMRLWLARLDQTPFRYPVKLEAQTGFGIVRGRLLSFTERPLTPDEQASMPR